MRRTSDENATKTKLTYLCSYARGVNRWLRSVLWFTEPKPWRDAEGNLLGRHFGLAMSMERDGLAIPPGLALAMELREGDKVKVTLERVDG